MSFFVIVSYYGDQNYSFDLLKRNYDFSFKFNNSSNWLSNDADWNISRIDVRECN